MEAMRDELLDRVGDYEDLVVTRGRRSEATIAIAVHSTALGPALGGARMWRYASPTAAIDDALDLARAMTLKASAADLDLGGGKGVICAPTRGTPAGGLRRALLLDFADLVESLEGRYITAEDVGTSSADMAVIAERTKHVVGLPPKLGGSGDPSPVTARGVESAIRACLKHRFGNPSLKGVTVCVVGLGHVGSQLARRLAAAGAELVVSDVNPSGLAIAAALGARWIDPEHEMLAECEVLAPCALGDAINASNVDSLNCQIICGSANNILADERLAGPLAERGIVYAPDFIANAGGLISVYAELHGHGPERVGRLADQIGDTVARVLETAEQRSITPLAAARELARERLRGAPRPRRPGPLAATA